MSLYEIIKDGLTMAQKMDNLDLIRMILDIQKEIQELQEENFKLKKECDRLDGIINKEKNIVYNKSELVFYESKEDGNIDGPYCPRCWQNDRKTVYLVPYVLDKKCTICNLVVGDNNDKLNKKNMEDFFNQY